MSRSSLVLFLVVFACGDSPSSEGSEGSDAGDSETSESGTEETGSNICTDLPEPPLAWDGVACIQGSELTIFFERLMPEAECFDICEDSESFGVRLPEKDVGPGTELLMDKYNSFYATVQGTPDMPPACFCGHGDFEVKMGRVEFFDYDGEVVCGAVTDFLPEAIGSFSLPISESCE